MPWGIRLDQDGDGGEGEVLTGRASLTHMSHQARQGSAVDEGKVPIKGRGGNSHHDATEMNLLWWFLRCWLTARLP
jgi:hypothetical protein